MMFLLGYWKIILIGILLTGVFGSGWYIKGNIDALRLESALKTQQIDLTRQCDKQKEVTQHANESYAAQVSAITAKLNQYRVLNSKCVAISSDTTNIPASGGKHAGQNGLTVDWLRSFAAECETYRSQRITIDKYFEDSQ